MSKDARAASAIANNLLRQAASAGDQLRAGLQSIRKQISEHHRQRQALLEMPVSQNEALARMEEWVDQKSAYARSAYFAAARFTAQPDLYKVLQEHAHQRDEYLPMAFLGDVVKAELRKEIEATYRVTAGISAADREAQLSALDDEQLDAELVEESIIRAAEKSGFVLSRRGNADPRAVLAPDSSMP